jgi:DNA-binding beta-propeller fold protein YncE
MTILIRQRRSALAAAFTLALALSEGTATAQEVECNDEIGTAASKLRSRYQAQLAKCMKEGNAADCELRSQFILDGEDEVRRRVAGSGGSCAQALTGGVPLTDLGPDSCPPAGARCDERIPEISTLDALAECFICMEEGVETAYRLQIAFPEDAADNNERKCIRSVVTRSLKAIRSGIRDVDDCADGGQAPFACPASDGAETKFGAVLAKLDAAAARCRDAAGQRGAVSGASAALCHHTAGTPADLASCAKATARCAACTHANDVYRQSQDCTAFSGIPCHGTTSTEGRFFVANEGEDSVSYFDEDTVPLFGTLASSTFPVGDAPVALAANPELNLVYVINSGNDTVTMLDAATGLPAYGTLANSSFAAGLDPAAVTVDTNEDVLYIADRGSDSVLLLNAFDGRPYYGTLLASTVAVGDEPRALMHGETDGIVYVANYGSDSLTYLQAATGAYRYSTFAASTFPTGNGPIALSDPDTDWYANTVVHVANYLDGTVTSLDGVTGIPEYGTLAASTKTVGAGPRSVTTGSHYFTYERLVYVASEDGTTTVLKGATDDYLQQTQGNATFPLDALPSAAAYNTITDTTYLAHPGIDSVVAFDTPDDILTSSFDVGAACHGMQIEIDEADNRLYASCRDRISVLNATTGAYAFGSEANSTFYVAGMTGETLQISLDPSADILYVGTFDSASYEIPAQLFLLDSVTGAQLLPSPISSGLDAGWSVEVNPALNLLYAMDFINGILSLFDATTGDFLSSVSQDLEGPLLVDSSAGTLYLAGGYDNSFVRYLDAADASPLFGTVEASTFGTGRFASKLALDSGANLLYVTNYFDDTVTFLDAATGAYPFGDEASSTFDTGTVSLSVAVDPTSSRLFVGGSERVTVLDSHTGQPKYGTLAQSKYDALIGWPPGANPVVVNPTANRLYVGIDYGLITYHNLANGGFINSSLPRTSVATGDAPSAIAVMQ